MALRNEIIMSTRIFDKDVIIDEVARTSEELAKKLLEAFLFFCSNSRSISTAPVLQTVAYWRRKHGLPAKGREYGPMRDLPDWSYADGRPAPLKEALKTRKKLQIEYCEKIIKLTKEVDECFELNKEKEDLERQKRQNVIQNRLKQKGKVFM